MTFSFSESKFVKLVKLVKLGPTSLLLPLFEGEGRCREKLIKLVEG
jgi:hypothetical protein